MDCLMKIEQTNTYISPWINKDCKVLLSWIFTKQAYHIYLLFQNIAAHITSDFFSASVLILPYYSSSDHSLDAPSVFCKQSEGMQQKSSETPLTMYKPGLNIWSNYNIQARRFLFFDNLTPMKRTVCSFWASPFTIICQSISGFFISIQDILSTYIK